MRLIHFLRKIDERALFEGAKDRYLQMFQNKLFDPVRDKLAVDVPKIMQIFRKADGITWYLRFYKIALLWTAMREMQKSAQYGVLDKSDTSEWNNMAQLEEVYRNAIVKETAKLKSKMGIGGGDLDDIIYDIKNARILEDFAHFFSLPIQAIQDYQFSFQTPHQALRDLTNIEAKWKEARSQLIPQDPERDVDYKVVLEFPDGTMWVNLSQESCELEGGAMGHCGNTATPNPGDTILSFRSVQDIGGEKHWKPHLTFIFNTETGMLGEMKGRANEKPKAKYHPYIIELLKQPFIKGIMGGGYAPEANFDVKDLSEEQQEALYKEKPTMMPLDIQYAKFGMTEEIIDKINGMLKTHVKDPMPYVPEKKAFVYAKGSLHDVLWHNGMNNAAEFEGMVYGEESTEWNGSVESDDMMSAFEGLSRAMQQQVGAYLYKNYYEEQKELFGDDTFEFDDWNQIYELSEHTGDDVIDVFRMAAYEGYESGMRNEMHRKLNGFLEAIEAEEFRQYLWIEAAKGQHIADKAIMFIHEEDLIRLFADQERFMEWADGDLEFRDMEGDNYLYDYPDFDAEAASEYAYNELPDEVVNITETEVQQLYNSQFEEDEE